MRRNAGFTLIEVIISLLILAITADIMASAFMVGGRALMRNQNKRIALSLAQEQIEYARLVPFGEDIIPRPLPEEYSRFTCSINSAYVNNYGFNTTSPTATDYIRIDVTVSYPDIPDITLSTVKYKYLFIPDVTP